MGGRTKDNAKRRSRRIWPNSFRTRARSRWLTIRSIKAGIAYADLRTKSRKELAQLLGVDAVISSNVRMDKPMSDGAALAVGAVFGVWGSTNKANTTINIHEGSTGNLMWKYQYQAEGSVGSSPDNLVDALMRNASRNFPYNGK